MRRALKATLQDVWDGIRAQPVGVALSFLAIMIGMAALTLLIAILGGLKDKSRDIVDELGVNVVGILQHESFGLDGRSRLHDRHVSFLRANLPNSLVSSVRIHKVPTLGSSELLTVVATDSSLIHIRQWKMKDGRFLDPFDIENRERNAVISQSLSRRWDWKVGNVIMIRESPFRVVGIVEVGGGALDSELSDSGLTLGERVVFIPRTVTPVWVENQKILSPFTNISYQTINLPNPQTEVDAIYFRVPAEMNFSRVVSTAQRLLFQPDFRVEHISWVSPESLIRGIRKLEGTIKLSMGGIVVISLVLGGTTLMSLMVANVRERIGEIGLRRAIGASHGDIIMLFVLEACLVTGGAAVIGALLVHLVLLFSGAAFPLPFRLGFETIFIPFIVSITLGALFSYWPAKAASRITPSEALRNE